MERYFYSFNISWKILPLILQLYGKALKVHVYATETGRFRLYLTLTLFRYSTQTWLIVFLGRCHHMHVNRVYFYQYPLSELPASFVFLAPNSSACYTDIEINRMDVETCMYNTRPLDWQNWYLCKIFLLVLFMLIILWIICTHIFEKCSKSKSDRTLICHYWSQFLIIINI